MRSNGVSAGVELAVFWLTESGIAMSDGGGGAATSCDCSSEHDTVMC